MNELYNKLNGKRTMENYLLNKFSPSYFSESLLPVDAAAAGGGDGSVDVTVVVIAVSALTWTFTVVTWLSLRSLLTLSRNS